MKPETISKIKEEIIQFSKKALPHYSIEELKRAFPFHSIFFTDEGLRAFKVQRTLVTRMGIKLYPRIAFLVAQDKYSKVFLNHDIEGEADTGMISKADRILDELRTHLSLRKPDAEKEWDEIIKSASGEKRRHKIRADLFIEDYKPGPLFMEIKSPRPNLDVCTESKKKMLYFKIINSNLNVEAYLAFPYNPFIKKEDYTHTFTLQIMDIKKEVLIGEEMWDKIGGKGTFEELLQILDETKKYLRS
jgi:hypothetical protein